MVNNVNFETPTFGDHVLVMATLVNKNSKDLKVKIKRNWKSYTPQIVADTITSYVNEMNIDFENLNVQEQWNQLEHVMIESADLVAPLVELSLARVAKPCQPVGIINRKINRRKRLLRTSRLNHSCAHAAEIKLLNKDIRTYLDVLTLVVLKRMMIIQKLL